MLWARLRAFFRHRVRRPQVDRSLDREIQSYLQMDIDAKVRSGLSPDAARRGALAEFGGVAQVKEGTRDARAGAWVDALLHDFRAALRTIRRTPAFSCAIVTSLSLGLASMLAAMGFLNGMLFRAPSGVASPDDLVRLAIDLRCGVYSCGQLTDDEIERLTRGVEGISGIVAAATANVAIGVGGAESVAANLVSANYFNVLGVRLAAGRAFRAGDDPLVAVIGHQLWKRAFAQDRAIIGRTLRVADAVVEIVGVAPEGFSGISDGLPQPGYSPPDIWLPLRLASRVASAGRTSLSYVGRLDPGQDATVAQSRLAAAVNLLAKARGLSDSPQVEVRPTGIDPIRATGIILLVLSIPLAVLAIASVNAGGLLMARASLRGHEIAVRLALGARRSRLVQTLLLEGLILALAATAVAIPLARWGLVHASEFFGVIFAIDTGLLGAALLVAAVTAVGFGLAPALAVSAERPARALAGHSRDLTPRQVRTRKGLVVGQMALSIGLLAIGTQLATAFAAVNATNTVDSDHVLMASFDLRQVNIPDHEAHPFYERLVDRASAIGGVEAVGAGGLTAFWRFNGGTDNVMVWNPGDAPDRGTWHRSSTVIGDLFQVVGARVTQGRTFTRDDHLSARPRVAVVNRVFADAHFGPSAIGRSVRVATSRNSHAAGADVTIVGIIEPTWTNEDGAAPSRSAIYLPVPLTSDPRLTVYMRTRQPAMVAGKLRSLVNHIDPRVPLLDVSTLAERSSRAYPESWLSRAAGVLGGVGLALAAFGLAALVSCLVTLRAREIAIRMALGARPGEVLRMVVAQALRLSGAGGAVGIPLALIIGQFIRAEFHQALGIDMVPTTISLVLLVAAALGASAFPALRASRVSPLALLKEQ
jgi:predicted permease